MNYTRNKQEKETEKMIRFINLYFLNLIFYLQLTECFSLSQFICQMMIMMMTPNSQCDAIWSRWSEKIVESLEND